MIHFLDICIDGIFLSSCYLLISTGLTLVFGVMKIVNFAHGQLYMIGAFLVWFIIYIGTGYLPYQLLFIIAIVISMLIVALIGIVIERGLFRPLQSNEMNCFLASYGLAFVLLRLGEVVFGKVERSVPSPFPGKFIFLNTTIKYQKLSVILITFLLFVLLWLFLYRTKLGLSVRACSQDRQAALLQGVNLGKTSALVMGLGSAIAAIGGGLMGITFVFDVYMGVPVIWKAFLIVIVGGLGNLWGTILASFLFGFLDTIITSLSIPQYVIIVDAVVMFLVLVVKGNRKVN